MVDLFNMNSVELKPETFSSGERQRTVEAPYVRPLGYQGSTLHLKTSLDGFLMYNLDPNNSCFHH